MKKKIPSIIFGLTFLPYLIALLYGIYCAVWGVGFFSVF